MHPLELWANEALLCPLRNHSLSRVNLAKAIKFVSGAFQCNVTCGVLFFFIYLFQVARKGSEILSEENKIFPRGQRKVTAAV